MTLPNNLRDAYVGAMVGTLAGDALGAPVEWKSPEDVAAYFASKGGVVLHDYLDPWKGTRTVKAGQPTDDSELAAALAQSLVERASLDEEDLYMRLRDFIFGNTPAGRRSILTEKAYGSGGTLRSALEPATYDESLAKFARGEVSMLPSNGSLMRCIGVPLLCAGRRYATLLDIAARQSRVTHRNEDSVAACKAFSVYVAHILTGLSPRHAWDKVSRINATDPAFRAVLTMPIARPDYHTEMKGKEGGAVLSLKVAVWASTTATSFRDGLEKAISVGGDTDTYGAITGGILGAALGYEAIPDDLKAPLQGRALMESLADGLYALSGLRARMAS